MLLYGVATMTGVRAWLAGCTKEELRNCDVGDEPIALFLRHADWDVIQVADPGVLPAPPAQPPPQQASTAGINPAVGIHTSSSGIPDGGDQGSVTGSAGGKPVFRC